MTIYEKGLITIVCVDALLSLVGVPLILRKVPRNVVYGYRTRATLSDDVIWYEANAYFGKAIIVASLVSVVGVLALVGRGGLTPPAFLTATIAALALPPFVAILATARFIHRLKQRDPSRLTPR